MILKFHGIFVMILFVTIGGGIVKANCCCGCEGPFWTSYNCELHPKTYQCGKEKRTFKIDWNY